MKFFEKLNNFGQKFIQGMAEIEREDYEFRQGSRPYYMASEMP